MDHVLFKVGTIPGFTIAYVLWLYIVQSFANSNRLFICDMCSEVLGGALYDLYVFTFDIILYLHIVLHAYIYYVYVYI